MCGLAGFLRQEGSRATRDISRTVRDMAATLHRRGPDDDGIWADDAAGLALGFRRLSILDLSPQGHQPMISADGRMVLVFNGEIYNFRELRDALKAEGFTPRGQSDSEIALEACAHWGVEAAVSRFVGMFAFALWLRPSRRLYLVRDRLGVKPLYWGKGGGGFMFGSELKALRAHPDFEPRLDPAAAAAYFRHGYVPAPWTIYDGIRKVMPGHMVVVENGQATETAYWSLAEAVEAGLSHPRRESDEESIAALESLFDQSVACRLVSDVPVGAFLSGGFDSSLVVASMQRQSARKVKTFSIGFDNAAFDEAPHAQAVADYLGTDHTAVYANEQHVREIVPRLSEHYDEPFADSSQIPTLLISQLARDQVTVVLTGDGADECFGGYHRYFDGNRIWHRLAPVPQPLRRAGATAISAIPKALWDAVLAPLPSRLRPSQGGAAMHYLAELMAKSDGAAFGRELVSLWEDPTLVIPGSAEHQAPAWSNSSSRVRRNFMDQMQYIDLATYLPDDILVKVDRASMAVSLEARSPFLDHRMVEFSWSLPRRLKLRDHAGKWILRQMAYRRIPRALLDRPKQGFGVPLANWLTGSLRPWAEDMLNPTALRQNGILDADAVTRCWQGVLAGKAHHDALIWPVLMFVAWQRRWLSSGLPAS